MKIVANELISVIMPAYNCEKYIADAIKTVLSQTYSNFELIIVNDCSVDGTEMIIRQFSDQRIRYFRNDKNLGVSATRNKGVKEAYGTIVALLDADDLWEPNKLEKQLHFMQANPQADFVFTASAFIDQNGKNYDYIFHVPSAVNKKSLLKQCVISCSSVFIKKAYLEQYPFPFGKCLHEDFVVWCRILEDIQFAYGIDEPLLIYRLSQNSQTADKFVAAKMQWKAYSEIGLKGIEKMYYMCWYVVKGVLKFKNLRKPSDFIRKSILHQQ